ncbi:Threonylcarbamoyl-AMP synthase [Candidatus Anstonella stagnisolia]|nr:Threonylcarbamoyl-AMP synthase [Candidatus Anstonella stagnisolia]
MAGKTKVMKPDASSISRGASLIKKGEVVAFPTETVYGLGANALDANAVRKIFLLKGRPADNPIIVHVSSIAMLQKIAKVDARALTLAKKCWPGPLTIIFEKKGIMPANVTCGLPTVAVRMPANKAALALIRESGVPIAAPSANISGRPSPTSAMHVLEDFDGKIPLILDGGHTKIGVESTVLSLAGTPRILRLGGFSYEKLKKLIPNLEIAGHPKKIGGPALSPGTKYRHYAPSVPLMLVEKKEFGTFASKLKAGERRVLFFGPNFPKKTIAQLAGQFEYFLYFKDGENAARRLFDELRDSEKKYDRIYFCEIEERGAGRAVMERVRRAAGK